jgi:site-specific DNA-methyltransferase (adenine-specific)
MGTDVPTYMWYAVAWDKRVAGWEVIAFEQLRGTGSLWVFGSFRFLIEEASRLTAAGFRLAQDIVWEKHNGSGLHADRFKRVHEYVVQFYRGDSRWGEVFNQVQMTNDAAARTVRRKSTPTHHQGRRSISSYRSEDGGPRIMRSVIYQRSCHGRAIHPTEKPVDLLSILLRTSCPPDGVVGDFFAGSGSCAEACAATGRAYIGCEIDPAMASKARSRCQVSEPAGVKSLPQNLLHLGVIAGTGRPDAVNDIL